MNIAQLLDQLDECTEPVAPDTLEALLDRLEIVDSEIASQLRFDEGRYQRNLLRRGSVYEALILCFEAGQRTPIHDHAGSACGVKVIQGSGVETVFDPTPDGWLYATGSNQLPAGGVTGSFDMDIHQLSNLQTDGKRLVTLHIYSPPLGAVGNYSIENNSVKYVTASTRDAIAAN